MKSPQTTLLAVLLSSTALFAVAANAAPASPGRLDGSFIVAQAPPPPPAEAGDPRRGQAGGKDKQAKDKAEKDKAEHGKPPAPPAAAQVKRPPAPTPPAAAQVKPPQAPAAPAAAQTKPPQAPAAPAAAQTKPPQAPAAPAAAQAKPPEAPPAQKAEQAKPAQHDEKRDPNRDASHERKAPAAAQAPAPQAPAAAQSKPPAPAAQAPAPHTPATAAQRPNAAPPAAATAVPPPPTKARSAGEFIRQGDQSQSRSMDDVRKERHETKDGNRVVIQEGDRSIERDGKRTIIRHNEADRFAVGASKVQVDRHGNDTVSIVVRPNGISIVTTTDSRGQLIRRVRRDRDGHEVVIIDNGFAGARRGDDFVDVRPPRDRDRGDRYLVDAGRARPDLIYEVLLAPPIERLDRRYTLDQVRYSYPLREYMPSVDLDVNFVTGSWQLTPDQVAQLSVIAQGINRAVDKNPREVFLIEGHTDAVGSDDDNLSLSDRRAEAVAVALTEQFQVPPENLVTQGYGEEYLKVKTDGPSRENRRVAVRRITPLIDQAQTTGGNR